MGLFEKMNGMTEADCEKASAGLDALMEMLAEVTDNPCIKLEMKIIKKADDIQRKICTVGKHATLKVDADPTEENVKKKQECLEYFTLMEAGLDSFTATHLPAEKEEQNDG